MSKKTYDKHFVKRDPKTLFFITKDSEPVPGELERTVRLHDDTSDQLNLSWENSGVVYILAKDQPKIKIEEKPKEEHSAINAMKKDELIANLEGLDLPTDGTVAVLKQRLIEAIEI